MALPTNEGWALPTITNEGWALPITTNEGWALPITTNEGWALPIIISTQAGHLIRTFKSRQRNHIAP